MRRQVSQLLRVKGERRRDARRLWAVCLAVAVPFGTRLPATESTRRGATCLVRTGEGVLIGGHGGIDQVTFATPGAAKRVPRPLGEKRNVFAMAIDGALLVEGGGRAGEAGIVRCWQRDGRKTLWTVSPHDDLVYSVSVGAAEVFAGSADGTVSQLRKVDGKELRRLQGHSGAVLAVALSPDGTRLATAGVDRSLRIWDPGTGELRRSIHNHTATVFALAWSADSERLASASGDRTARLWQPRRGRLLRIFRGHEGKVLSIALQGKQVITGGSDGTVCVFDRESARLIERRRLVSDAWIVGVVARRDGSPTSVSRSDDSRTEGSRTEGSQPETSRLDGWVGVDGDGKLYGETPLRE